LRALCWPHSAPPPHCARDVCFSSKEHDYSPLFA
jgi:hypothetical protein